MTKVLVVDDDEAVARALRRMLKRAQFETEYTTSPEDALRKLETYPADVVLSDFRMPSMNGIELLKLVREKAPGTLCFIVSGQADLDTVLGAADRGEIVEFFGKPWDDEEMIGKILEAVRWKREGGPVRLRLLNAQLEPSAA